MRWIVKQLKVTFFFWVGLIFSLFCFITHLIGLEKISDVFFDVYYWSENKLILELEND